METVELKPLTAITNAHTMGGATIPLGMLPEDQVKRMLDQLVTDTLAQIKQAKMNYAMQSASMGNYSSAPVSLLGNLFGS